MKTYSKEKHNMTNSWESRGATHFALDMTFALLHTNLFDKKDMHIQCTCMEANIICDKKSTDA